MLTVDLTKKRKIEENGVSAVLPEQDPIAGLIPQDVRKIIERFTTDQLLDILQDAASRHIDVLNAVRSIADQDPAQRKLFIRGLGWDTTTEGLRTLFSAYGDLEEAIVILDKATGKSKGYGFVTFKHVDGALLALKEPSKKIDGRVAVAQLAAAGNTGASTNPVDIHLRKIYVGSVPYDMPADKLLSHFAQYGEIEEGPLGFDKHSGKSKGFALFVYKTAAGAQEALREPVKNIDGRQMNCKLAIDGKKGKPGGPGQDGAQGGGLGSGDGMGMGAPPAPGAYGGPGGLGAYGGFSGGLQGPPPLGSHHLNSTAVGASSLGASTGSGGYGSGLGGPYGGYGGPGSTGYGGAGGGGLGGTGGGIGGAGGGLGGSGVGSSLYRMPPSSAGMPSGGYPDGAHYNSNFPSQHHQGTGTSPLPRVPPGGMYPNAPYF
ncbi:hypothetical protein SLA2020_222180 [Shorea laevis]